MKLKLSYMYLGVCRDRRLKA